MAYLAYNEYTSFGGTVSSTAFTTLELKARRKLDYFTQDRLKTATTIIDEVKEVMARFIDKLSCETDGGLVSSVSHDGVSIAFDNSNTLQQELEDIAVELLPIELISAKVDRV